MLDKDGLIVILWIIVNILTGIIWGLMDSRNYWKKKWEQDEEDILLYIRGQNDK